jgi:hypothetical protein
MPPQPEQAILQVLQFLFQFDGHFCFEFLFAEIGPVTSIFPGRPKPAASGNGFLIGNILPAVP